MLLDPMFHPVDCGVPFVLGAFQWVEVLVEHEKISRRIGSRKTQHGKGNIFSYAADWDSMAGALSKGFVLWVVSKIQNDC